MKCKYCQKEFDKKHALSSHQVRCSLNPNRVININFIRKGKPAWNKGLDLSDPRMQKRVEKFKINKALGLHKDVSGENNINSRPEVREKKSINKKKWLLEHPDKVPYKLNHSSKESYPEIYFKSIFEDNNIPLVYHKQVGLYQLDFCNESKMYCLEIDGEQHYYDKRIVEHDKVRTEELQKLGWTVERIRWAHYKKLSEAEKKNIITTIAEKLHS